MAQEFTSGRFKSWLDSGLPNAGGRLYTFASGTTTFKAAYTDATLATPCTYTSDGLGGQYIALNARGEAQVWLGSGAYTMVDKTPLGVSIDTVDGIDDSEMVLAGLLAASAGAGMVGIASSAYSPNTVGGALFTTVWGDGATDKSANLLAANALGYPIRIKGVLVIGTPTTITVPIVDTLAQIFSTTSQVTISNGLPVRPEWFGTAAGAGDRAIAALPSTGGTITLENKVYANLFQHAYNSAFMSKDNVMIVGAKMPQLASDCKSLVNGTIATGGGLFYANGVEIRDMGFDSGFTWCNAFNGGTSKDGLSCTYGNDTLKNANAIRNGLRLRNVIGLAYGPSALNHGVILAEGYENVRTTGEVAGCFGVHGIAIKAQGVRCQQLTAYCTNQDGVIIKTDLQTTAVASDIQIDSIEVRASGPVGSSPYAVGGAASSVGVYVLASGGSVDKVQIGAIEAYGYPIGFGTNFTAAYNISDVSVDAIIVDQQGVASSTGVQIFAPAGEIHRMRFGSITARNTVNGVQAIFNQGTNIADHLHIDRLEVVNATNALDIGNTSYVSIGTVIAENCSGGVYHITSTPKLLVGQLFKDTLTTTVYSAANSGLAPSLSNGWTQVASNDPFGVDLTGGRVNLRGLIKPGTTSVPTTLPQWAWPTTTKRTIAQGYNGTTQVAVPVSISTGGVVSINEVAGGFANCSTWLSLTGVSWDLQA